MEEGKKEVMFGQCPARIGRESTASPLPMDAGKSRAGRRQDVYLPPPIPPLRAAQDIARVESMSARGPPLTAVHAAACELLLT